MAAPVSHVDCRRGRAAFAFSTTAATTAATAAALVLQLRTRVVALEQRLCDLLLWWRSHLAFAASHGGALVAAAVCQAVAAMTVVAVRDCVKRRRGRVLAFWWWSCWAQLVGRAVGENRNLATRLASAILRANFCHDNACDEIQGKSQFHSSIRGKLHRCPLRRRKHKYLSRFRIFIVLPLRLLHDSTGNRRLFAGRCGAHSAPPLIVNSYCSRRIGLFTPLHEGTYRMATLGCAGHGMHKWRERQSTRLCYSLLRPQLLSRASLVRGHSGLRDGGAHLWQNAHFRWIGEAAQGLVVWRCR